MASMVEYLGIYPEQIERFSEICDTAMEKAGFTDIETDDVNEAIYNNVQEIVKSGSGMNTSITNAILIEIGTETVSALSDRYPQEEFDYVCDGEASCLVVNGEEYVRGEIMLLFENYYTDEELSFADDDFELDEAHFKNGEAIFTTDLSVDNTFTALMRGGLKMMVVDDIINRNTADINFTVSSIHDSVEMFVTLESKSPNCPTGTFEVPLTADEQNTIRGLIQERRKVLEKPVSKNDVSLDK